MSTPQQPPVNINYRLINIVTEEFETKESEQESGELNLNFDFQFGINGEKRFVKTISKFIFQLEKNEVIKISVGCEFEFEESGWNYFVKGDKLVLPKELLTQLAFFAMNTTRGVLHAKTEGHKYNKLVIPMINGDFIKQDLEMPLQPQNLN